MSFNLKSILKLAALLSLFAFNESFTYKRMPTTRTVHLRHSSTANKCSSEDFPEALTSRGTTYRTLNTNFAHYGALLAAIAMSPSRAKSEETAVITRSDIGSINLNSYEPPITDVCWLDIAIGSIPTQRIEISLYGTVTPVTAANFKSLCMNVNGVGYRGSEFFRIISEFSVQGGSIGNTPETPLSRRGRLGRSASGVAFPPENYKILHSYENGGVISMMKELTNAGKQDSRFFITLKSDASWGDDRYSAFGRVTKGMDVIRSLILVPVEPPSNYPKTAVNIVDSGVY